MSFWTDLIWIGNTLYPRWFVITVVALIIAIPVTLVGVLAYFAPCGDKDDGDNS